MKAPPRLLDHATAPTRLRADLARVSRASHTYDAAHGLAQLQANLRALDAPGAGSEALDPAGSVSTLGTAVRAGWAVKTFVATVIGVGSWTAWTAWPAGTPQQSSAPQSRAAEVTSHAAPPSAPAPAPSIEAEPPRAVVAPVPTQARAPSPQRKPAHREIEQLEQVKARMATDPAGAYQLARQSAREFPSGVLREEREGLSVLALWQMGRQAEARAAAERFLLRYPRSPLRARVEQLSEPQP